MALLARSGLHITLIAVTDGEASHPTVAGLANKRAQERETALDELACSPTIVRLQVPDGRVSDVRGLDRRIERELDDATHVFAPLPFDGHPDHNAVGLAATCACERAGVTLVRYAVWAWHWAQLEQLPFDRCRSIKLDADVCARKQRAIRAYRSQIEFTNGTRILHPMMLEHFARPFETVFV